MRLWIDVAAFEATWGLADINAELPVLLRQRLAAAQEIEAERIAATARAAEANLEAQQQRARRHEDLASRLRRQQPWKRELYNLTELFKHRCVACRVDFYAREGEADHKADCKRKQTECPKCDADVAYDYCHKRGQGGFVCRSKEIHGDECPFQRDFDAPEILWWGPCQYCDRQKSAEQCSRDRAAEQLEGD